MEKLKQNFDVEIRWRSYELRPAGSPPIPADYLKRIEQSRPVFNARMKDDHGIDIVPGKFGINSRQALIVEKYAEAHGHGEAFHNATQAAYWLEGKDISDHAVLREMLQRAGLQPDHLEAALSDPRYDAEVQADVEQAIEYGLQGVPALVLNDKYLLSGAQPYATLAQAVQQLQSE